VKKLIKYCSERYNYHEFRNYQKRESYHKKVISEQKAEIKKLKLDTQKLETAESEKPKANKSMAYFKKQNSEYREINQNQKQVILQLQRDLSDKDRNIDNLIAQVNELIEDKMSVETFSEGEYLPFVRLVVQDLHSFGVGVKHIGQTIQTVLKHLIGIEGVKVLSESSSKRMILESNLLAKLQVGEKNAKSWIKYFTF
jgi:superfamily II DNA helicase RecQ